MTRTRAKAPVPLSGLKPEATPSSKGHKAFERLVKQIESARGTLEDWAAASSVYQEKYISELLPLQSALRALQVDLVRRLDAACGRKGLTQADRRMVSELVVDLAGVLLSEKDDEQLRHLYERHNGEDYDAEERGAFAAMKATLEEAFGVDLTGAPETGSPEDLLRYIHERQTWHGAPPGEEPEEASDTAQTSGRRRESQEHEMQVSLRAIYRRLASVLHPDRESDPEERARKTVLMQKANDAYENNRLLPLLELRRGLLRTEDLVEGEDEKELKLYTKSLKKDLADLRAAIRATEGSFCARFGLAPFSRLSPTRALASLTTQIKTTRELVSDLRLDLEAFDDPRLLKDWLKSLRRQRRET